MGRWKPCREQPKAAEIPQSPVEPGGRFSCCYKKKKRMSEQWKMKVESLGKKIKCGGCQTRTRCPLSTTQEWWRSNTFAELPIWKKEAIGSSLITKTMKIVGNGDVVERTAQGKVGHPNSMVCWRKLLNSDWKKHRGSWEKKLQKRNPNMAAMIWAR